MTRMVRRASRRGAVSTSCRRASHDYDTDASFAASFLSPSMPERPSDPDASAATDPPAPNVVAGLRERPSKTRRKQESHDLQSLGEALLELPDDHLATLGLGESLRRGDPRRRGASRATKRAVARCS